MENSSPQDAVLKIALSYKQDSWPKKWPRVMVQKSCSRDAGRSRAESSQLWEPLTTRREAAYSDLAFSSTWPMMGSPLGVPVASHQVWTSLVRAAVMTRNPSGKCWKAPASQPLDPSFYWCAFCGTKNIPQSKRKLHIQDLRAISCHISLIAHFRTARGREISPSQISVYWGVTESRESTLNSLP